MDSETRHKWGFTQTAGAISGTETAVATLAAPDDTAKRHVIEGVFVSGTADSSVQPKSATINGPTVRCSANDCNGFGGTIKFGLGEAVTVDRAGTGSYWIESHLED